MRWSRQLEVRMQLPAGVQIEQYADQPRVVAESVWSSSGHSQALAIVVCFLFLGWRTGIVVATGAAGAGPGGDW
jgi:multidrug efflux pump subunit AcrB